jgi:hypothetical protein
MEWVRLYHDIIGDPKLIWVADKLEQPIEVIQFWWVGIIVLASKSTERGKLLMALGTPAKPKHIAQMIQASNPEIADQIIEAFLLIGLLEKNEKVFQLKAWENRQVKSDNSTKRKQEYRNKLRFHAQDVPTLSQHCPVNVPSVVPTLSHTQIQSTDTDTDMVDCTNNIPTNSVPSDDELLVSSALKTPDANKDIDGAVPVCFRKVHERWPELGGGQVRETLRGLMIATSWQCVRDATINAITNNPQNPIAYIKSEARRMHKQVAQNV